MAEAAILTVQQRAGTHGAAVLFLFQVLQAIAIERHHGGFGAGEKAGENDQQEQDGEQYLQGIAIQGGANLAELLGG
jgi:hypothetical protein